MVTTQKVCQKLEEIIGICSGLKNKKTNTTFKINLTLGNLG